MSGTTTAVAKLAKPQLRGHLRSYIKRHLSIAMVLSVTSAIAWHYFVAVPRKKRYADFYATYDIDKELQRYEKLGLLKEDGSFNLDLIE